MSPLFDPFDNSKRQADRAALSLKLGGLAMKEYFAASRIGLGNWNSLRWFDDYTAALSLGKLTNDEAAILRQALEGDNPEEYREIYIVSEKDAPSLVLRVRMLAKRFVQEFTGWCVDDADFPPYYQPIKSAYEAACMVQQQQRLPNFESLFYGSAPSLRMAASAYPHVDTLAVEETEIMDASNDVAFSLVNVATNIPGSSPDNPFYICAVNSSNTSSEIVGGVPMEWVPVSEAANRMKVAVETLQRYRTAGQKPSNGSHGVDSQGNQWRMSDNGRHTEYWLPRIETPE